MSRSNRSFFEYNLTRAYPFKHFTILAIVFCLIWLGIATVINVLSQGYVLVTTYSTDWTGLVSRVQWYESIIAKKRSSCQPKLFEVGDSFRSNNSGLMYTLAGFEYVHSSIRKIDVSAPANTTGETAGFPGLVYSNQLFDGCTVESISIHADSVNSFI